MFTEQGQYAESLQPPNSWYFKHTNKNVSTIFNNGLFSLSYGMTYDIVSNFQNQLVFCLLHRLKATKAGLRHASRGCVFDLSRHRVFH